MWDKTLTYQASTKIDNVNTHFGLGSLLYLDTSPKQSGDKSVDGSIAWEVAVSCNTLCSSATELAILVWRHVVNKFIDSVHAWQVKVVRKSKRFLWENERALKHKITAER